MHWENTDLENLEEERILERFRIVKRDSAGYVKQCRLGRRRTAGTRCYALGVPSPAFSLEEDGDEIRCVMGAGMVTGCHSTGGLMAENEQRGLKF